METKKEKIVKGVKAFNKDMKCRDYQFENGKEYEEPDALVCNKGFHFCEKPIDVFNYYAPADSVFAEVEGSGKISKKENEDSKVAVSKLKVGLSVNLQSMIEASVNFVLKRTTLSKESTNKEDKLQASNSAHGAAVSNSGYSGAASNSGYSGAAFSIGSYSSAETEAEKSVAVAVGYENKAKGSLGSWIVLAERNDAFEILSIVSKKVNGKTIKANVWYKNLGGKLVEL